MSGAPPECLLLLAGKKEKSKMDGASSGDLKMCNNLNSRIAAALLVPMHRRSKNSYHLCVVHVPAGQSCKCLVPNNMSNPSHIQGERHSSYPHLTEEQTEAS